MDGARACLRAIAFSAPCCLYLRELPVLGQPRRLGWPGATCPQVYSALQT